MLFELNFPEKILFGRGKLNILAEQRIPGNNAMVVISNGKSARQSGALDMLSNQLDAAKVNFCVFDGIGANPTDVMINQGAAICREAGCDFMIALGGGSVIDSAKMIAILARNPGEAWDYVQTDTGGCCEIKKDPLPIIAIPTTAGTGSEVDFGLSFSRMETGEKITVKDSRITPVLTIIDPTLTDSLPKEHTAYQGWDALTHSIEYLLNNRVNEMCDMFAREAIRYARDGLVSAVVTGDYEAREKMALASCLSGIAIGHGGVTSQHALECALSAVYPRLPHGAGLLMLSRAYFGFLVKKRVCDEIFIELAQLLGNRTASKPEDFLKTIAQIQHACGVDSLKMSDYGITPDVFPQIIQSARSAMAGSFAADRICLTDEDCLQILQQSYR